MIDRWTANKLGLVNFWYYDEEEFDLIDGKLLLRGANGSGKSVTMQSFIPLLLDGNKRPERLDPFGTNARRIENYLLVDEDETERTAYLYMEFKKNQSEVYITIGMGLKAVKGRKVDAWYFIITDGRRVKKDIDLYRDKGYEKTPLTKKELENLIGEGGFFTDLQGKYKEKVNEYLFGYSDIESYEELIDLLINIRTPKLSRDFKPTAMYEILENSLRQLTEEDLRPMSEAMENMDNIKLRIEQLKVSQKAAKNIDEHYSKYNKFILKDKATKFLDKDIEIKGLTKEIEAFHKTILETKNTIENLKKEHIHHREELDLAQRKIEEYKDSDVLKAKDQLEKVKDEIEVLKKNKADIEDTLEEKQRKLKDNENKLKEKAGQLEGAETEKKDILRELEDLSLEFSFAQHEIFSEEFNLNYIKDALIKHRKKIKEGKDLLQQYEKRKQEQEDTLENKDLAEGKFKEAEKKLKDATEYLTTVKEEFIEKLVKWHSGNTIFKIEESSLQETARSVMGLEDFSQLHDSIQPLRRSFHDLNGEIVVKKQTIENLIKEHNKEITSKENQIKELKEAKEVEFHRSEEVMENRRKLKEMGIPYLPLYKALDFSKNVVEKEKQAIEAALVDLGIIDALIIPTKYKKQVLTTDSLGADKYLFSAVNFMGYSLAEYLIVDKTELDGITYEDVDNLLRSVLLDENSTIYLNEKGSYGMGILQGKVGQSYELKYIGATARKQHRERLIEELNKEIEKIKEAIKGEEENLHRVMGEIETLEREYKALPNTEDLNKAFELILEYERDFASTEKVYKDLQARLEELEATIRELKKQVFEATEGLQIEKTHEAYEEALETSDEYREYLTKFQNIINNINSLREFIETIKGTIEDLAEDVSEKIGAIGNLDRQLKEKRQAQEIYQEILSTKGYDEIKEELDRCYNIAKEYPDIINEKGNEIVKLQERVKNSMENLSHKEEHYLKEKNVLTLLQEILLEEYQLGYVMEQGLYDDPYKLAQESLRITETFANKSREEFDNALHESFTKSMGALRDYQPKTITIFKKEIESENREILQGSERKDIRCRVNGKEVNFNSLRLDIEDNIKQNSILLTDREREFFQEILLKTISNKIKSKIYLSKNWVNQMNKLMESMNTSSSLKLTLRWEAKKAEHEGQLDTSKLVEILQKDEGLIRKEDIDELSKHFFAKIEEIKRFYEDKNESRNYHSVIKEILDYRKWFEFKLYSKKEGEKLKELTNNAFFQLSGGEKAMAMYIPLFTAVYSKFDIADKKDCPRVVALDEAFAGVDEGNIRDMFRILKEMKLDYILNSQVLWGDYDTVEGLAICEIIRPDNSDVVTVFRYQWNGKEKVYLG